MTIKDQLLTLTRQLLPTGRAFRISPSSVNESVEKAFILSEERLYNDSVGILDTILPDNDNFTTDDATRWEQRLGMITNELVSLEDRKLAIKRKMNHPGDIKARQSRDYIENSLRAAGFDVYVYENPDDYTIEQVLSLNENLIQLGDGQLGDFQLGDVYSYFSDLFLYPQLGDGQLGDFQLGLTYSNKIVNHIEEEKDALFDIGTTLRCTFFIGGLTLGSFATVDVNRKDEFRQLVLKLKPVQNVGYLLINYI